MHLLGGCKSEPSKGSVSIKHINVFLEKGWKLRLGIKLGPLP